MVQRAEESTTTRKAYNRVNAKAAASGWHVSNDTLTSNGRTEMNGRRL
jgi:hypothetical protein